MKRREFITLIGGAAAAWPLAARAQQPGKVFRIGFFGPAVNRPSMMVPLYQAFLAQLRVLGFNEGQNLNVTYGAVEDPRGLSIVAAELLQSQPDLIVVSGTEPMLQAVLAPNRGIPIVLIAVNFDPIARGYIKSLAAAGIRELARAHRLPTMFLYRPYVDAGGLMSYGVDFPVMYRRTADYVAKILKGAKPDDLPVEQATKLEMVVNLKTAKAIGVELPTAILLRADEVIE